MSHHRSPKLPFRIAIGLTVLLALLPWRAWTNDVAAIVSLPLAPVSDGANGLLSFLRPVPAVLNEAPIEQLVQERDMYEQRLRASELRIAELEDEVEQLQGVPIETLQVPVKLLRLRVTARAPTSSVGPIDLQGGTRRGVPVNSIAVYNGVHLIGRVIDVSPFRCRLLPITNPDKSNLYIQARVRRADQPDLPLSQSPAIQITPDGHGAFTADVDRASGIAVGDVVLLDDDAWPETAQARTLGVVESVQKKDEEPLRERVIVRPRYQPHQLSKVTLIIEQEQQTVGLEP